ncbi:hypothetical protein LTR84_011306 [Exophiala bonariae]|uniref:Uncharacterized protein n=1 Tax=Exophiala bonariae TaxID=1690606 RepID=A0AAV9MS88_9EURO|nr:hypothetical protein LTR84_011306 [Exophiala bonariae]
MQKEATLALCIAILLSQYPDQVVKLPKYSLPTSQSAIRLTPNKSLDSLVDKCITLSCAEDGIESILGGSLLDPGVPCNLIGAWFLGIRQALSDCGSLQILEKLMAKNGSTIAPLWMAAIWCEKTEHILDHVVLGYSPVSLPVSTWIGIPQSFIQYDYVSSGPEETIPRANEYRMTYLVNPSALPPMTPYPPLGYTHKKYLSLEVRSHLSHDHYLQNYRMFWAVQDKEDILAQSFELPRRTCTLDLVGELPQVKPVFRAA